MLEGYIYPVNGGTFIYVHHNLNFDTFYNEIDLKNGIRSDINAIKDTSASNYV